MPDKLSPEVLRRTLRVYRECGNVKTQAARILGIGVYTLSNWLAVAEREGIKAAKGEASSHHVNTAELLKETQRENDRLRAENERLRNARKIPVRPRPKARAKCGREDTIVVLRPDFHGFHQDPVAVGAYLDFLKRLKPHRGVGMGDLGDCGGFLAQHHVWGYVAEAEYTLEADDEAVNRFLDAEDEARGGCEWDDLEGNHDHRPETWAITAALRNKTDAAYLLDKIDRPKIFQMTRRGRRWRRMGEFHDGLPERGVIAIGKCWYVHGHHIGGKAASQAVASYGTNIVFGHTHRMQEHITRSGNGSVVGGWTIGHLSQNRPYWQHGRPNGWVHGFAIQIHSKQGNFQHINIPIVDGVAMMPDIKL